MDNRLCHNDDAGFVTAMTNALGQVWSYAYDALDRRTNEVWSTGRAMAYGYDDAHQLTSVAASRPSDAARYRYDAAGNPVDRAELGLDVTNSFNNLNQIVTGSWTGSTITVAGSVNYPVGSISVNNTPGTVYPDSSFDVPGVPVVPGTNTLVATYVGPAFTNVPMTATGTSTIVLGDTAYTHDANGNLTGDATFIYQYDLANQLTNVVRKADNTVVLQCRYDALGRRVEAIRSDGTVDRYVYFPGSFLVLAVLDENNAPKELYTRGPDLSGTLDSAGGIGGILACTYASSPVLFHHADLMGNVVALTDISGAVASTFRYTSWGQLSYCTGIIFPRYQFSTKEHDHPLSLHYYGCRHYSSRLGRWLSRDPIAETGGVNLYNAMKNASMLNVDYYGKRVVIRKGPDRNHEWLYRKRVTNTTSDFEEKIIEAFRNAATYADASTGRQLQCLKILPKRHWFSKSSIVIRYQPGADFENPCCKNSRIIQYLMAMFDSGNDVYIYQTIFNPPQSGGAGHIGTDENGRKMSRLFVDPRDGVTAPLMGDDGGRGPEAIIPFDVKLMHELLGHAEFWFSGKLPEHPKEPWNVYDSEDPRLDPFLERENEYRAWKGYPLRYGKYYESTSY